MAKKVLKKQHESGKSLSTKSFFGSHSSMVVDHLEYIVPETNKPVYLFPDEVLCKDDEPGFYITYKNRIDSGLADPQRYSSTRRKLEKNPDVG
jgi:hypothetical protein